MSSSDPSLAGSVAGSSSAAAAPSSSLAVLENAFARFSDGVTGLQHTSAVAQKRLEMEFASLDGCVKSHEQLQKEYQKLLQMFDEVERENESSAALSDYRLKLDLLRRALDKLRDTKPRTNLGLFMRLMLGQVNMSLWKNADRIRFKDEYNKFKSRTTFVFILWPLAQLVLLLFGARLGLPTASDMLLKAHQLWLLYYYTTLSLRENILLANGSDIMHWWIYHHYLSMLLALIMLLWPNPLLLSETRLAEMMAFGLVQGLVMLFQNNYQKKRLYVRKTLGKARAIDVDSSETLVEKPTDLAVLVPMLFGLYAMELFFGGCFIRDYLSRTSEMPFPFSVLVMGVAFVVLAVGNAFTTGMVLVSKSKHRHLIQAVKERVTGKSATGAAGAKNNSADKAHAKAQ